MDNKLSLETITALLIAAEKIRSSFRPELREGGDISVSPGKLSAISETMQMISGYIPEVSKPPFNKALESCNRYCGVYCDLKRHLRSLKGQSPDVTHLLSTLKAVMPMLDNKRKIPLRKAVSILEAMKS